MEDALRNTEETVNIVLQDDTATLTEKFKTDRKFDSNTNSFTLRKGN